MSKRSHRLRHTLVAGTIAIVIGAGLTAAGLLRHTGAQPSPRSAGAPLTSAEPAPGPSDDTGGLVDAPATADDSSVPAAPPTRPATTKAKPKPSKVAPKPNKPEPNRPKPNKPKPKPPANPGPPPSTGDEVLDAVLADINAARRDAGLPAYVLDRKLSKASALHNQLMINGCGLEHQCPGESGIGDRFSAQGVSWSSAGENIGLGSAGSSTAEIIRAANGLTAAMLAERPPNDGHRKNLLSRDFKKIGLSVVRAKGQVWLTQDFVN